MLAAFVGLGIDAGHLVTASVISAPASLLIAKILQPETETPETLGLVKVNPPKMGTNVIEAAAIGASDGLKLALNVAAMGVSFGAARLARLGPRSATAISIELGMHNATLAIAVGASIDPLLTIPAAVYSTFMFLTAGTFAWAMHRRNGDEQAQADVAAATAI